MRMPMMTPVGMEEAVAYVREAKDREEALQRAFDVVTKRFRGARVRTYLELWRLRPQSAESLWKKTGFMHCTNQNFLLGTLLVASGYFRPEEIETKWTTLFLVFPHQYALVRLAPGKVVDVDPWAAAFGIRFGDHAHGFHRKSDA